MRSCAGVTHDTRGRCGIRRVDACLRIHLRCVVWRGAHVRDPQRLVPSEDKEELGEAEGGADERGPEEDGPERGFLEGEVEHKHACEMARERVRRRTCGARRVLRDEGVSEEQSGLTLPSESAKEGTRKKKNKEKDSKKGGKGGKKGRPRSVQQEPTTPMVPRKEEENLSTSV